MHRLMMWRKLGSEICVKLISILMPELVRRLVCWLITAEEALAKMLVSMEYWIADWCWSEVQHC
jgi:hypothetical protein